MVNGNSHRQILIVGAGPAGFFAARKLNQEGIRVVLLNRDIKPGGLAEYGIYYDKYRIKEGLRKQFRLIMSCPSIDYVGNITVGNKGDITLDELRTFGFDAILITAGAQGTKKLGLPGEELKGVYHAKEVVFHYNLLPPYSTQEFRVRGRLAIVGVGNVMMDIAHWAVRDLKLEEVIGVARRGPAEIKFTQKEMGYVVANLDVPTLNAELSRCAPYMIEVNQDPQKSRDDLLSASPAAMVSVSKTRLHFAFLSSPTQILGDNQGNVTGLEVEDTKLIFNGNDTKAVGLGTKRTLNVDSVIFCIGDTVDPNLGLPIQWNEYVKNPNPIYPIDGISYEAFDSEKKHPLDGVFVAGWSRQASSGLVGLARKDGENAIKAMLEYLKTRPVNQKGDPSKLLGQRLQSIQKRLVHKEDVARLEAVEESEKQKLGLPDFKFKSNEEMIKAIL